MKKIAYGLLLMLLPVCVKAQQAERMVYSIKDADTLWIDHYKPTASANGMSVLFVHGGAFTGGDPSNQTPLAEGLNKLGYRVFVMKYRLYLKGKSFGCETATPEKLKAIRIAIEDAENATAYLATHFKDLDVDTTKLFLTGSSAGAETVLNLVWNPFKPKKDTSSPKFKYAGVLSFSGALLDLTRLKNAPVTPLLMMHGTNDQLVPFGTDAHRFCNASDNGWLMMFGSSTIYQEMRKKQLPVILYTYEGLGHEVSNFMFRRFAEMDTFMKAAVNRNVESKSIVIAKQAKD
ncbi:alpha/beta hydrolase fold domain-containing protein [Danxiaibacter flavus]|uniref:Alpha/beta hydrolase fold domain-containing protein n=1 Tax=Danxiaibacter flavus TaxID=3049108 RepID=A0ABV3ZB92_9BACT|nr:alpha/beta hydrolase fold domain-containing protein [Chitinophagaceae bacterium DXS]